MRELLTKIERAVRARGWSARQASIQAVGTPELIRDMRRGRVPSVERFRALCEALDLEFYVGPHRESNPVDIRRLERALETAEKGLHSMGQVMGHAEKARVVSVIYDLIGEGGERENAARIVNLLEAVSTSPISGRAGSTEALEVTVPESNYLGGTRARIRRKKVE